MSAAKKKLKTLTYSRAIHKESPSLFREDVVIISWIDADTDPTTEPKAFHCRRTVAVYSKVELMVSNNRRRKGVRSFKSNVVVVVVAVKVPL